MADLFTILNRGYFPRETPPPFQTLTYAKAVAFPKLPLPIDFQSLQGCSSSLPLTHNLPRPGSLRRKLSIPNPVNFYQVAKIVSNSWADITAHCNQSQISLTTPHLGPPLGRAISGKNDLSEKPNHRARIRSTSKYLLTADISQFYNTLYTHTLSWALHSKNTAKAKQTNLSLLGNQLDLAIRLGQDKQTLGIPIGPDTSLVAAEIVLTAVDRAIILKNPLGGFRYIDDYEFGFHTYAQAEQFLSDLQGFLNDYELQLNPTKTGIEELPKPVENTWASELRLMQIRSRPDSQKYDLIWFFDRAVELAQQFPMDSVIRFAIGRTVLIPIASENWDLFQQLLLETTTSEPGSLKFAIDSLKAHADAGLAIDASRVEEVFNNLIRDHAPRGHGNEVAWAIWGILLFNLYLADESVQACEQLEDSIVALLVLDARSKGLCSSTHGFNRWEAAMTQKELFGRLWLLAYEANIKRWLPTADPNDHVDSTNSFRFFKQSGVFFYDENAAVTYKPQKKVLAIPVSGSP